MKTDCQRISFEDICKISIQIKREAGFREIETDDKMNMGEHSLGLLVIGYFSTSLG